MTRVKIVIQGPEDTVTTRPAEIQRFYRQLNKALRRASEGREWAVEAGTTRTHSSTAPDHSNSQCICHLAEPKHRLSLIAELLDEHDLRDQATLYREKEDDQGWAELETAED